MNEKLMRDILEEQKNMTDIAISRFTIEMIDEFYDPDFMDNVRKTFIYNARKSYDSLHFEENRKGIQKMFPEIINYSLENNLNPEFKELNMANIVKISKWTLDAFLFGIRTGRVFKDKGIDDIDDVNTNIKICGYYMSAYFAKDFCNDDKTYKYLQRKSIEAYKELKDDYSRKVLLDFVDKGFLKIK